MKSILSMAATFIAVLLIGYVAISRLLPEKSVTETEFRKRIDRLEYKVDSLQTISKSIYKNTDSLKSEIRFVKKDIDTLKKGNYVIFEEVKKVSNSSLLERIKQLF